MFNSLKRLTGSLDMKEIVPDRTYNASSVMSHSLTHLLTGSEE